MEAGVPEIDPAGAVHAWSSQIASGGLINSVFAVPKLRNCNKNSSLLAMEGGVPEIDLSGVEDAAIRQEIVDAMAMAWRTWGVFLIVNHGVQQELLEEAREQAMRVFTLPVETKQQATRASGAFSGYGNGPGTTVSQTSQLGSESVRIRVPGPDLREFGEKLWPGSQDSGFCEKSESCISVSLKLLKQLVELLCEGLPAADAPHILSYFPEPCEGAVRLNFYPNSTTLGLPAHTDIAAVALLHQSDQGGGLQVEKDGEWVTVQARSDALVVIMGTVFQILTNGDRKACEHRAIQEDGKERLSLVYFLYPDPSLPMAPAPSFLEAHKQRLLYKSITFPEFWVAREANLLDPLRCIAVEAP